MSDEILWERRGRIGIVTLNRPDQRNALATPNHRRLREIFDEFRDDDGLWVAIVTGAGDSAFCAGADLKELARLSPEERRALLESPPVFAGITREYFTPKPIIAAVNGFALGGGTELALACDLVVAAENATFGLTEPRVGRAPGAGGMQRLPRQIPLKQAMGMMLTARRIGAEEASRLGLVNEIVPEGEALNAALRWAGEIMAGAPLAVRAIKASVHAGLGEPSLEAAMKGDADRLRELRTTEDYQEGMRAFAERRSPEWQGK